MSKAPRDTTGALMFHIYDMHFTSNVRTILGAVWVLKLVFKVGISSG